MSREVRSRILLGIGIPLAAFLFLVALILSFSRILLAVPEELAPWVALLFAATILTGCALAATIRGTRGFAFLIGILVLTILGGGAVGLALGQRPVERLVEEEAGRPPAGDAAPPPEAPPEEGMPPPPPPPEAGGGPPGAVMVVAQGIAFDTSEISLPAGGEATIDLDNRDAGIPHNVAIYAEDGGEAVFQGKIITGPATVTYRFPSPAPGQYRFQCDVHPQMAGTVAVG